MQLSGQSAEKKCDLVAPAEEMVVDQQLVEKEHLFKDQTCEGEKVE